jgi:hypothetical protein
MSIHKLSNKGYMTIVHPENERLQYMKGENSQSPPAVHQCYKGTKKKKTNFGQ